MKRIKVDKHCVVCGAILNKRIQIKYCSRNCINADRKRISELKRMAVCKLCGKEFVRPWKSGKGNRGEIQQGQYCSVTCRSTAACKREKVGKYHQGDYSNIYYPLCKICGKQFIAKRKSQVECSDDCKKKKNRQQQYNKNSAKKATTKKCQTCGNSFESVYGDFKRTYCSDICRKRNERLKRGPTSARKKARHMNVYYEHVNPLKVFIRDKWKCQLCGKKLSIKDRGTTKDDAPELDHIIPWAKGGEHSYRNTQCACRKCNIEKGDKERGQLMLFG